MDIINPLAEEYAQRFTEPEDDLLAEVARETMRVHPEAHMLSGHLQGSFLQMISRLVRPSRVLEVGTFTGYSAICLSKGLLKDGVLHTIELREEEASLAQGYFARSNTPGRIILHQGNALDIIPKLNESWDLVFIDADKANYINYYNLILPFVKPGGIILADNVLFHGQVLTSPVSGKNAKAIQAFNEYLQHDKNVEKVMLTIRDGLLMIRKKD